MSVNTFFLALVPLLFAVCHFTATLFPLYADGASRAPADFAGNSIALTGVLVVIFGVCWATYSRRHAA